MTLRLPVEQARELEIVAAVDGQPVSEVIRTAIDDHIAERKRDPAFQDGLERRIEDARRLLMPDQPGGS